MADVFLINTVFGKSCHFDGNIFSLKSVDQNSLESPESCMIFIDHL